MTLPCLLFYFISLSASLWTTIHIIHLSVSLIFITDSHGTFGPFQIILWSEDNGCAARNVYL